MHPQSLPNREGQLQAFFVAEFGAAFAERAKRPGRRRSDLTEQVLKDRFSFCGAIEHTMRELAFTAEAPAEADLVLRPVRAFERFARALRFAVRFSHGWEPRPVTKADAAQGFYRATLVQGKVDERQQAFLFGDANLDEVAAALYEQRDAVADEIALVEALRAQRDHGLQVPGTRARRAPALVLERERQLAVAGRGD